jgi:hypothetical protein
MTDSSLWRKSDSWQTAASGGKRMGDSSLLRMGDSSIRREKNDRPQPMEEEGCETAASGGKKMTDSSLWRKKDGRQQHPERKG